MSYDVKEKIDSYLKSHNHLTLATVTPEGTPMAHTVGFVNDGDTVFFVTDKSTRKAINITNNPNVFFTVDEDFAHISECRAIQMAGLASLVTDGDLAQNALGMIISKFPFLADMPPNPNMVVFQVKLIDGDFIDHTVHIGYRAQVQY